MKNISIKLVLILSSLFIFSSSNVFSASKLSRREMLQKKVQKKKSLEEIKQQQEQLEIQGIKNTLFLNKYHNKHYKEALNIIKNDPIHAPTILQVVLTLGCSDEGYFIKFIDECIKKGALAFEPANYNAMIFNNIHDPKTLKLLLERGLDPNPHGRFLPFDSLIEHCFTNQIEPNVFANTFQMIFMLLNKPCSVNPNFRNEITGDTALIYLAKFTKSLIKSQESKDAVKSITELLLGMGSNPNFINYAGETIYIIDNPAVLEGFCEYYAKNSPNEVTRIEKNIFVTKLRELKNCIFNKNFVRAKEIVEQYEKITGSEFTTAQDGQIQDHGLRIADFLMLSWGDNLSSDNIKIIKEIFDIFLKRGFLINSQNEHIDYCPILFLSGSAVALEYIIECGADLNQTNKTGTILEFLMGCKKDNTKTRVIKNKKGQDVITREIKNENNENKIVNSLVVVLIAKKKSADAKKAPAIKISQANDIGDKYVDDRYPNETKEIKEFIKKYGKFAEYVISLRDLSLISQDARKRIDID